ncbi:MAG TPA: hypothetical protein VMZ28_27915 [Kofleriaceae bacterium]|nr:hypothetical protein [Kofleriaceae bacterium]
MVGTFVLVCSTSSSTAREVKAALAVPGTQIEVAASTAHALELVMAGAVDLLLVEWPSAALRVDAIIEAAQGQTPVVALAREDGKGALAELFSARNVMHVCVGRAGDDGETTFDADELAVTAQKILGDARFGVARYLGGETAQLSNHVLVRADDRDRAVERLTELVRALGGGRRMVDSVALVADELITNAVYNAPRCPDGAPRYAHVNRREKITLDPSEYVRLEYGTDGKQFALAVVDNFGALHPDTLRSGVHRCLNEVDQIEQKAGGAGIGLYTALSQCTQLVVNVQPGACTEIIALWDLSRRGRGARAGAGSLHVFTDDLAVRTRRRRAPDTEVDQAIPEPTVTLSESVRQDIDQVLSDASAALAIARPRMGETHARHPRAESQKRDSIAGPIEAWRERADLTAMRGVQLLRRVDRPGLDTTMARIRGSGTLADALSAAMTFLVNDWTAALMLCQIGDTLVPWIGAGDIVEDWDDLARLAIPLAPEALARGSLANAPREGEVLGPRSGWFGVRATMPGVSLGPVTRDVSARRLSELLIGTGSNEAMAMSFGDEGEVLLVMFATRARSGHGEGAEPYEKLHAELDDFMARIALPTARALQDLDDESVSIDMDDVAVPIDTDDVWSASGPS